MKRERLIPLALAASAVLAITACSSDGSDSTTSEPRTTTATPSTSPGEPPTTTGPGARPQGFGSAYLEFFGDCDALLDYMKAEAGERVTAWGLGGDTIYYAEGDVLRAEESMDAAEAAPTAGGDGGATYSGTNTQEVGVDEGDLVETDGEYVYVATTDGVRIVAVDDPAVVDELDLPEGNHQLLLDGDRLLVITSTWTGSPDTVVSMYDVADPEAASLLRRSHLEGVAVATRGVDGVARVVVSTSFDQRLPFVQPNQFGLDEDTALERNKEIIAESTVEDWLPRWFDERGDGSFGPMDTVLPCEAVAAPAEFSGLGITWIGSLDMQGDGAPVGSAGIVSTGDTVYASTDNLYIATQNWGWQGGRPMPIEDGAATDDAESGAESGAVSDSSGGGTSSSPPATADAEPLVDTPASSVVTDTIDPPEPTTPESTDAPATTEVAETTPETSEAPETTVAESTPDSTPDSTDVTQTTVPERDPNAPPPTLIHQFSLGSGTDADYVASGAVEGRLLNQFAMSEYEGDLRVATTTDDWGGFGDQSESTVYVLRPNGTELEQISSVGGLGKGERIYAVRFLGATGYVVTFRQVDPLYVLDLSDPENPVLDGELKIPGYSAYLHPVGDGLLLGVGQDATLEGRTQGTKLSLFDVSDPTNPQEISTLPIGGYSEVEWDHKAFLFWEPDGTIVLPVSPGWSDCVVDDCLAKQLDGAGGGAVVARLDGRQLVGAGTISHGSPNQRGCWNPLQRSIVIDDELVTVGPDQVKFSDRATLEARDSVSWGDPEDYGCYWYVE